MTPGVYLALAGIAALFAVCLVGLLFLIDEVNEEARAHKIGSGLTPDDWGRMATVGPDDLESVGGGSG